ncbi:hypothetical protein GGX14DRAFT_565324 [Mycena pura]|uniref:Uncharacterized protein n=1 Tax=Mycena pura TaxID=153505 RepID=A0AAD6YFK4_9AGAR|nr:hypothetical protein GGX14DRAFT_565324 [Mycena pura]
MNYTVDAVVFDNYWGAVLSCTYGTFTEICFFGTRFRLRETESQSLTIAFLRTGVLVGLISAAAYLLHKRVQDGRRVLVLATCAMALFATLQLATMIELNVLAFRIFRLAVQGEMATNSTHAARAVSSFNVMYVIYNFLLVVNNMVTDSLLIYRCYIIWNRNIRVVIVPTSMPGLGFLCSYENGYPGNIHLIHVDFGLVLGMVLTTNIALMALTAGRIWWIRREVTGVLEPSIVRTYNTVIAIMQAPSSLESGAIYCISMIIYVVSVSVLDPRKIGVPASIYRNLKPLHPVLGIFRAVIPQIVNIAPTLVIVRVVLRRNVENTVASSNRRTSKLSVGMPPLSMGAPSFHIREPSTSSTEMISIEETNGLTYPLSEHLSIKYDVLVQYRLRCIDSSGDTTLKWSVVCVNPILAELYQLMVVATDKETDLTKLDAAVARCKERVDRCPAWRLDRCDRLASLGYALWKRFEYKAGAIDDIEMAVTNQRQAVKLCLVSLGPMLLKRFERLGRIEDLNESIECSKKPPLNNLGNSVCERFRQRGDLEDIEEAIRLGREALALRPAPHNDPDRASHLDNLEISVQARFWQRGPMTYNGSELQNDKESGRGGTVRMHNTNVG